MKKHGFTLVETLVVSVISVLVFGALISLFIMGKNTLSSGAQAVDLQQTARYTMDRVLNELSQTSSALVTINHCPSQVCNGDYIAFKTPQANSDPVAGTMYCADGSIKWGGDGAFGKNILYLVPANNTGSFSPSHANQLIRAVDKVPAGACGSGSSLPPYNPQPPPVPPPCFLAGASILMANGAYQPIEKIKVGDKVMSVNEKGRIVRNKVTKLFIHPKTKDYLLVETSDGRQLKVTKEHRVYSSGEYKPIATLPIDSPLTLYKGGKLIQTSIVSIRKINSTQTVYNFDVENSHTYFAEGILVHNRKLPPPEPGPPGEPEGKNYEKGIGFKAWAKKFFSGLAFAYPPLGSQSGYNISVIANNIERVQFFGYNASDPESEQTTTPEAVRITVTVSKRSIIGNIATFSLESRLNFKN